MIGWSIQAAKSSGCFDRVVVSTDDIEIANIARDWGAEVPFIRPSELSGDHTGTIPVIRHAVQWLQKNDCKVEFACCIYATAPFLIRSDLRTGWALINESMNDYAFSVTSFPFPIQRALRVSDQGRVAMINPGNFMARSQDLEESWHDAGQFYWGTAQAWCEERALFGQGSVPVKLPRYRVQDIDTLEDWTRAEWLFRAMQAAGEFK